MKQMKIRIYASMVAMLLFTLAPAAGAQQPSDVSGAAAVGQTVAAAHLPVCQPGEPSGTARCHAQVVVDVHGKPQATTSPTGYSPSQFRKAYNLTATGSASQIIAIVDAYDDPTVQSDLNTYSTTMGIASLPTCSGPVASSSVACFQKVDQRGGTAYPVVDGGWALEISLDVQTAHGICPGCSILLVEADSSSLNDLFSAVDEAAALHAKEISNSYGTSMEFSGENTFDFHFNHPGIAITVSSGDSGYGTSYPTVSPFVTSVGGTTLNLNADGSYNSESAWSGSGSGCSSLETLKPANQPTVGGCSRRIIADVAADADPNTGASVYDATPYSGQTGWFQVGGTSLSSPLIAAVYALAGGVASGVQGNTLPYAQKVYGTNMHDVTSGATGRCKRSAALCNAVSGYDGPTGLGTPKGTGAF